MFRYFSGTLREIQKRKSLHCDRWTEGPHGSGRKERILRGEGSLICPAAWTEYLLGGRYLQKRQMQGHAFYRRKDSLCDFYRIWRNGWSKAQEQVFKQDLPGSGRRYARMVP